MTLYRIFCKSYYRRKNGTFIETRADASPTKEKYEHEGDNPKIYGCGSFMGFELDLPYKLPVLREERSAHGKILKTIYRLTKCPRCNCPQNGSPVIEAEEVEKEENIVDVDYSFDYFGVFGLETTATGADIKKQYIKLSRKYHTDKAKNDEERRIFKIRFADIGKAYEVLKNEAARKRLINNCNYMEFACPGCGLGGKKRSNCIKSNSSMRWFHSADCGKAWNKAQGYDVGVHTWTDGGGGGGEPKMPPNSNNKCAGCGNPKPPNSAMLGWDKVHGYLFCSDPCTQNFFRNLRQLYTQGINKLTKLTPEEKAQFINQIDTSIPGNFDNIYTQAKKTNADKSKNKYPKRKCAGCGKEKTFIPQYWHRWSERSKDDYSCTEQCLFDYYSKIGTCPNGKKPRLCYYCGEVRKEYNSSDWRQEKGGGTILEGMFFCKEEHLKAQKEKMEKESGLGSSGGGSDSDFKKLKKKRQELVEDIVNLDGWDKLPDTVQNDFIAEVNRSQLNQLDDIWKRVQDAIRNYFQNLRDQYIQQIKALDKLTKSEKSGFINLINTGNPDNFENVLAQAKDANQSKGEGDVLKVLKNTAIAEIEGELLKEPVIKNSELQSSNQNWKSAIQNADNEGQINSIKAQVLTDIAFQRQNKKINICQNLENVLEQIKKLRSSDSYSEEITEIKAIEARLQELDPTKFKKTSSDLLVKRMKDNGLTENDLDNQTKAAIEEVKKTPTSQNIEKAEDGIEICGANKNLSNILNKVNQVTTSRNKKTLIDEILSFISKNKYNKTVYQNRKVEVEKALAQLRGEKYQENTLSDKPPYLAFALLLIGGSTAVAFFIFLIWKRKKKLVVR
ncbi:MAG: DnaJ domain-containing protein [Candidatus Moeniiplasma glomeromycotorum]|nr:DnaJ domain-containing protein [Candidatus Moeniiplasma glomeromycotorum]MCE8162149.1 DnaJ domain-containing protein [Candidatus Moeniiplasma glomeromycotorum]MCE8166196.1 DnaJ domain-containing protein [Candidatus Moeniiplasma glomeromycotorum]MCE8166548.1 DnaJ domain-containing protein [Candidatus Moeniiplasma glomeromycotorum]